jgi:hypothetical protein
LLNYLLGVREKELKFLAMAQELFFGLRMAVSWIAGAPREHSAETPVGAGGSPCTSDSELILLWVLNSREHYTHDVKRLKLQTWFKEVLC